MLIRCLSCGALAFALSSSSSLSLSARPSRQNIFRLFLPSSLSSSFPHVLRATSRRPCFRPSRLKAQGSQGDDLPLLPAAAEETTIYVDLLHYSQWLPTITEP